MNILAAARRLFARDSYENVGMRDIARVVGVDPSLIIRYFGSKEELFREIFYHGKPGSLFDGVSAQDLPAHLVALITEKDGEDGEDANAKLERLLIILRSASSSKASAIVHEATDRIIIEPIASLLDGPDARLRACLALTVLSGSGIMRQILSMAPPCEGSDSELRRRLLAMFETALAEASPAPAAP